MQYTAAMLALLALLAIGAYEPKATKELPSTYSTTAQRG